MNNKSIKDLTSIDRKKIYRNLYNSKLKQRDKVDNVDLKNIDEETYLKKQSKIIENAMLPISNNIQKSIDNISENQNKYSIEYPYSYTPITDLPENYVSDQLMIPDKLTDSSTNTEVHIDKNLDKELILHYKLLLPSDIIKKSENDAKSYILQTNDYTIEKNKEWGRTKGNIKNKNDRALLDRKINGFRDYRERLLQLKLALDKGLLSGKGFKEKNKNKNKSIIYYHNPNELIKKLETICASADIGNDSVYNDGIMILDELLKYKHITKIEHKSIFDKFFNK